MLPLRLFCGLVVATVTMEAAAALETNLDLWAAPAPTSASAYQCAPIAAAAAATLTCPPSAHDDAPLADATDFSEALERAAAEAAAAAPSPGDSTFGGSTGLPPVGHSRLLRGVFMTEDGWWLASDGQYWPVVGDAAHMCLELHDSLLHGTEGGPGAASGDPCAAHAPSGDDFKRWVDSAICVGPRSGASWSDTVATCVLLERYAGAGHTPVHPRLVHEIMTAREAKYVRCGVALAGSKRRVNGYRFVKLEAPGDDGARNEY